MELVCLLGQAKAQRDTVVDGDVEEARLAELIVASLQALSQGGPLQDQIESRKLVVRILLVRLLRGGNLIMCLQHLPDLVGEVSGAFLLVEQGVPKAFAQLVVAFDDGVASLGVQGKDNVH